MKRFSKQNYKLRGHSKPDRNQSKPSVCTVHCTFQLDFKNTRCKNLHCIRSQKSPYTFLPVHMYYQYVLCYGSIMDVCPDRKNLLAKWRVRFHLIFFLCQKAQQGLGSQVPYACHSPPLLQVLVWFIRSKLIVGVKPKNLHKEEIM